MRVCARARRRVVQRPALSVWRVVRSRGSLFVHSPLGTVQHAHLGGEPQVSGHMRVYVCFWAKVRVCASATVSCGCSLAGVSVRCLCFCVSLESELDPEIS